MLKVLFHVSSRTKLLFPMKETEHAAISVFVCHTRPNVVFLSFDNELSGIMYVYLEVGKIFSKQYLVLNLS